MLLPRVISALGIWNSFGRWLQFRLCLIGLLCLLVRRGTVFRRIVVGSERCRGVILDIHVVKPF
jgi:hypothetical protein